MQLSLKLAVFVLCFVHGLCEVPQYSLKNAKGKAMAKLEGTITFSVESKTYARTIIKLPQPEELEVEGGQTLTLTNFTFVPNEVDLKDYRIHNVTMIFNKDAKSAVNIQGVRLYFSMNASTTPENARNIRMVEWNEPLALSSNSSFAYKCSEIVSNISGNIFTVTSARLQPFDLSANEFGTSEICPKDQVTTTTVQPSPAPKPDLTAYVVTSDDFSCIRFVGNLSLHITYATGNGSTNATAIVIVPQQAKLTGNSTCNYDKVSRRVKDEQILHFVFNVKQNPWYLMFNFTNNTKITHDSEHGTVQAYAARLDYVVDDVTFVNASSAIVGKTLSIGNVVNGSSGDGALALFKADTTHHYKCNNEETTQITNGLAIRSQKLKAEAFLSNITKFLDAERICVADQEAESSDIVPIITGAALATLVLFVLIAYLVGRARAKQSTYETI